MKRTYWVLTLSVAAILVIGAIVAALIVTTPKAGAPANENNNSSNNNGSNNNQNKSVTTALKYYLIGLDDNGRTGTAIGCGDSAVAITTEEVTTTDKVKSTFERMLSNKDQYYGESGLYNALYQSNLTYVSNSVSGDTVTVKLTGNFKLGGTCDTPRVQAQLERTAQAAAGVKKSAIFVNDKPLSEVLSQK